MKTLVAIVVLAWLVVPARGEAEKLIVHEWGTFTSLQDGEGHAIGGINTDDEALPGFVHALRRDLVVAPLPAEVFTKGIFAKAHPDVTMRLETPVVYFYPPKDTPQMSVNVKVDFRGGWLSQFYPAAQATAPGFNPQDWKNPGRITPETVGSLAWNVKLGIADAQLPATTDRVWTAPRKVPAAASVTTTSVASGAPMLESEKFLFYRGVGHVESPLRVASRAGMGIGIRPVDDEMAQLVRTLWLVEVRADGRVAFREPVGASKRHTPHLRFWNEKWFEEIDFAENGLSRLRESMLAELVKDGLYADEAEALLNTWEESYFKRPGLRLFFIVPKEWTDRVLPIEISPAPVQIERVMVGRIEIVTPEQRELLAKLSAGEVDAEKYVELGRFAHPLVLHEQAARPSANLQKLIKSKQLDPFELK